MAAASKRFLGGYWYGQARMPPRKKLCASQTARKTPISLPDDATYRQLANLKREWNDIVPFARQRCANIMPA
jgi:hypothetical protein